MKTKALAPQSAFGASVLILSAASVSALILATDWSLAPRFWVVASLSLISAPFLWRLLKAYRFRLYHIDGFFWALMISHTVIIHVPRDIRALVADQTPTAEIAIQIGVWVVCLGYTILRLLASGARAKSLWGPAARYATIFTVHALASGLYSVNPSITLAWGFKLTTVLLMALLLADRYEPLASCERILSFTQIGLTLMVLQFVLFALLSPDEAISFIERAGLMRAGGDLIPPTQLGGVAGLCALLWAIDLLSGRREWWRWLALLLSFAVMIATLARGGILSTSLTACLALWLMRRARHAIVVGLLAVMLVMVSPSILQTSWDLATRRQRTDELLSLTGRVPVWGKSRDLIEERPILGWGYVAGARVGLMTSVQGWISGGPHNAYLEILLTLGVVGALVLAALLWSTLRGAWSCLTWRRVPSHVDPRVVSSAKTLVIVVFLMLRGLLEGSFSGPPRFETIALFGAVFCADMLRVAGREVRTDESACASS